MNEEVPSVSVADMGRHPRADQIYYIEEPNRPGEFMPIEEDEHGTYIMNSRDLRAVEHVQRLVEIGIDCLKIEGRTKSHYYTAQVTRIYRKAIDDAVAGKSFDASLMGALESLANRGYTDGFFQRHETHELQNYRQGASLVTRSQFVGEVLEEEDGWALVDVKNRFQLGDELNLVVPEGNLPFRLEKMLDKHGEPLNTAPGSGWQVRIPLPRPAGQHGLITRNIV
jgi:putative protease